MVGNGVKTEISDRVLTVVLGWNGREETMEGFSEGVFVGLLCGISVLHEKN